MAEHRIAILNRIAIADAGIELVCNNPTDTIRFEFDAEWSGIAAKTARFSWDGKYIDVPFSGNVVVVPEIYQTNYVYVGVFADNIASTPAKVKSRYSIKCLGGKVVPPSEDVYAEIIALINAGINANDGVGVSGAFIAEDAHLFLTLTTGENIDCGKVQGKDGVDGKDGKDGKDGAGAEEYAAMLETIEEQNDAIKQNASELEAFEKNRPFDLIGNPVQVESFEGMPLNPVTVFAPKQAGSGNPSPTNIRPITGYDVLAMSRVGKNLFLRENILDGLYIAAQSMTTLGGTKSAFIKCKPNTTYTVSKIPGFTFRVAYTTEYPAAGVSVKNFTDNGAATHITFRTGSDAQYLVTYVWLDGKGDNADAILASLQIEEGGVATAYESPGNTYTVQIGQTVYGGKIDWLTGKLVVEWGFVELGGNAQFDSVNTMVYPNGERIRLTYTLPTFGRDSAYELQLLCNQFVNDYGVGGWNQGPVDNVWILSGYPNTLVMALPVSVFGTTEASVKAKLAETPLQVAYKLKTPTEIQLTPHEILALSGTNTLYGDGEINISGRTDMQAVVSNLLKRIATLEATINS